MSSWRWKNALHVTNFQGRVRPNAFLAFAPTQHHVCERACIYDLLISSVSIIWRKLWCKGSDTLYLSMRRASLGGQPPNSQSSAKRPLRNIAMLLELLYMNMNFKRRTKSSYGTHWNRQKARLKYCSRNLYSRNAKQMHQTI
jgi:hypothetical protein